MATFFIDDEMVAASLPAGCAFLTSLCCPVVLVLPAIPFPFWAVAFQDRDRELRAVLAREPWRDDEILGLRLRAPFSTGSATPRCCFFPGCAVVTCAWHLICGGHWNIWAMAMS